MASKRELRWYEVLTPSFSYVEPIMDDGSGPTFDGADWLLVEAHTAREAISRAVHQWLKARRWDGSYCRIQVGDQKSPFTGIKATLADMAEMDTPSTDRLPYPDAAAGSAATGRDGGAEVRDDG